MTIDRNKLHSIINALAIGGPDDAPAIIQKLKAFGIERDVHVGRTDLQGEEVVEWYVGQGITLLEDESWFAVNSYVNALDKFVPLREHEHA